MNEEIKEWKTQSYKSRVAHLLMLDCVSFSYNEEDGIVFTAPAEYVERLKRVLVTRMQESAGDNRVLTNERGCPDGAAGKLE